MTAAAPRIRCTRCAEPYPSEGTPYLCPRCGGVFDFVGPPILDIHALDPRKPGLWRFSHAFDLPEQAPVISLGEGGTPLIPFAYQNQTVWLKLESLNPTGSYKDRGSAVLLSQLAARGVTRAVEDSSGNAGASFAAYAARAGLHARVFVPESASGPKRSQIESYGAELMRIPGPRSAAAAAVLKEVQDGPANGSVTAYGSHAYLPFGLAGIATIAYELWEQLGRAPGTVIAPVGHGGLLLGIMRGFAALAQAGLIERQPYYVGVQAQACAPVWLGYTRGVDAMASAPEEVTVAEGVRVRTPVRAQAILQEMAIGAGRMEAVAEAAILPAYRELARAGVHVEPTSALVWAAFKENFGNFPEPITLILSGAGLKYQPTVS